MGIVWKVEGFKVIGCLLMEEAFKQRIITNFGEAGELWLASLPQTIEWCVERWGIVIEDVVEQLSYNYVVFVRRKGIPCVLKLSVPGHDARCEMAATEKYDGRQFVKLLNKSEYQGAQLLERLQPGRMLSTVDEEQAFDVFCRTWEALRTPVDDGFPHISEWFTTLQTHTGPMPINDLELATCFAQEILKDENNELLHGDLHQYNILEDEERGWCGIDPKGIIGDSYFDCVPFLLNECPNEKVLYHRLEKMTQKLSLNRNRLIKAAIALATVRSCWATEDADNWYATFEKVQWLKKLL